MAYLRTIILGSDSANYRNYAIHELGENPGLYFERLPDIRFIGGQWTILVFVEKADHGFDLAYFQLAVDEIKATCEQLPIKNSTNTTIFDRLVYPGTHKECLNIFRTLEYIYGKINTTWNTYAELMGSLKDLEDLKTQEPSASHFIVKRNAPWFGFIGAASRFLFGTLSGKNADYYNEKSTNWPCHKRK